MPFYAWPSSLWDTLFALCERQDVRIVLAHADRYPKENIERLIREGIPLQLNAVCLTKPIKRRRYLEWIQNGYVKYLGSDIHMLGDGYRDWKKCKTLLERSYAERRNAHCTPQKHRCRSFQSSCLPFNGEPYIGAAIRSVLAQSYARWELLILDDGSADRTAEIAEAFEKSDPRIRLFRNPKNLGAAQTRNPRLCSGAGRMDRAAGLRRYMAYRQAGKAACSCIAR